MLISICTCTYNSADFLEKALHSVESQSYYEIEHIINDSYSTDGTLEIINAYIQRNCYRYPIKLIQTPPKGVANALNNATEAARGEVIHFLHSDDYYTDPYALTRVSSYFSQNPDLMWLTGNFLIEVNGKRMVIPHSHLLKINPELALTMMNFVHHENTFVRRSVVDAYGGFCEDNSMNVEYRLWLRLIQDHSPMVVNDQFTVFIIHKGSTSTGSVSQFSKAIFRGFKTQHKEKVFPLIGYYQKTGLYRNFKTIIDDFYL